MDPLFCEFRAPELNLANRIVMAPMTRNKSPNGIPGDDVAAYYRRRAEGGVGLIVTEGVGVEHGGSIGSGSMDETNIPVMYGDVALAGWRRVVDEVHAAGSRIFPQLWHMGPMRLAGTGPFPDAPSSRPSGLWGPAGRKCTVPRKVIELLSPQCGPMPESSIAEAIAAFGSAAANAKSVGFDGIAIHGAHGYLIDSFLWAETNYRPDQWGGSLQARSRFAAEVVRAIRAAVGPNFPIMFRYSQWKQQDYAARLARTPDELETMLRPMVDAGVDIFDASTRRFELPAFDGADMTLAGWTKKLTGRGSMAVGSVGLEQDLYTSFAAGGSLASNNLSQLRACLESGEFDLIGVGRALIADPQWPRRAATGEAFVPFRAQMLQTLV
jgi:2,4-dienoyl-CoA reductase-like NADH-dependent reductase (Old Yellow Enzyme family)